GMADEHEGYGAVFASLHPKGEPRATISLFARLAGHAGSRLPAWQMLAGSVLFRFGLVTLHGDGPLPERSLVLAEGLWPVLAGINYWPAAIAPLPSEEWVVDDGWFASVAPALERDAEPLVWLHGPAAALRARQLTSWLSLRGMPAHSFDVGGMEAPRLTLLLAHCLARGALPVLWQENGPGADAENLLTDYPGPLVLAGAGNAVLARLRRPLQPVAAPALARAAHPQLWRDGVPQLALHAAELAARFPLAPDVLARIEDDVSLMVGEAQAPLDLDMGLSALKARLPGLGQHSLRRVTPRASWDDLVLAEQPRRQLSDVIARLKLQWQVLDAWGFDRGEVGRRGVRMLFCGLPGTGKTLAAEVVAHELASDLVVVDLARVLSKWIGETEKNLGAVFDEAESCRAVLFFDEADALFTRRTEVGDANDRYANIETAYLLTRLERFDGVAVLATNLRQQLDRAFLRRFEAVVDFPEPGEPERAAIWRRHLPASAPLAADVDFDLLAAVYPMSGAMIRNALLAAAYLAAADNEPIGRAALQRAIVQEFEKSGRPCPQ
ncbi:MAG TPA: ATP-binding protein, partial [Chitinolyticbacter sp.]|nr:ATP-binding protein [Chitinolyticbacter sp.]